MKDKNKKLVFVIYQSYGENTKETKYDFIGDEELKKDMMLYFLELQKEIILLSK